MNPKKPFIVTLPLVIIALVAIICVGAYLIAALILGNQIETTENSNNSISGKQDIESIVNNLDKKYDFVMRATKDVVSQNLLINTTEVKETDIIVKAPGVKGPPPIFRISGDKIIWVNYGYDSKSAEEFQDYVESVAEKMEK